MYTILKKLEHIENILMAPTTYRGLGDVKFQTDDDVILYEPELIGLNQRMSGDTGKYLIFSNGIKTSYIVGSHIANNRQISSTNSGTIYVTKIPKKVSDEVEMKAFESGKKLNDVRKGLGLDSDSLKKLVETRIDKYIEEEMAEGVDEDYTKEDIFKSLNNPSHVSMPVGEGNDRITKKLLNILGLDISVYTSDLVRYIHNYINNLSQSAIGKKVFM